VPESLGGTASEASVVTGALVAEDLAQGDLGLALAALAPIGVANALVRWGSADQQARYLPAFAEATPPHAAVAIAEPRPLFDPNELRTRATIDGDGFLLRGEKSLVPLAESAELLLVAASLVGKGPRMFIIERGTAGMKITREPALGARAAALGRVTLDDVRLPSHAILGEGVDVCDFSELVDLSRIALCALSVGTAQAVLEYVIQYCNDRQAFGEPISNRQAVAFMIANIGIEVESMRLLTWRAASRAEQGMPFHREAYLARVICMEKGMEIGTNGVQLLGGHGFIKEHPVERWYRDLMTVSVMEGGLLL
jgi:alkylation response protein AidB-like acyl-CoA dehydrogenase